MKITRRWDDKIAELESDIVVKTRETERTHREQRRALAQVRLPENALCRYSSRSELTPTNFSERDKSLADEKCVLKI